MRTTYSRELAAEAYDAAVSIGAALGDDTIKDTKVKGLGDRALRRDGRLITLFVDDGDAYFSVQIEPTVNVPAKGDAREELDDQVLELARLAIRRA